jgi:pseudouridine kinase
MSGRVLVIGGANTDIIGFSNARLVAHDSNPGHVRIGHGGVGRNIAENLARLGVDVHLVTAVGDDTVGHGILSACAEVGIDTSSTLVVPGAVSSSYVAVMDEQHDLEVAINDMRVLDRLSPGYLDLVATALGVLSLVALDANLPAATLEHAVELWPDSHILLDPVSAPKAPKAAGILGRVSVLKANALEAAILAGIPVDVEAGPGAAVDRLLDLGVARVFVSRGDRGVYCADRDERITVDAPHVEVANTTGAGDAFAAGLAYATLEGMSLKASAGFASAVAGMTLATERTVSDALTPEVAHRLAKGLTS